MTSLGLEISAPVDSELFDQAIRELEICDFLARLFRKDPSIWSNDSEIQDSIEHRLGWLDAPERAQKILSELTQSLNPLLEGQFQDLLFLGMGGSSAFARILEGNPQLHGSNGLRLTVLDSLIPDQVHHTLELMAAPSTLIIVASKSGGTVETLSLAEIAEEQGAASRMIAITDPGTSLEAGARERGYWGTFLSWSDVGGRFSALTAFGLVPAILVFLLFWQPSIIAWKRHSPKTGKILILNFLLGWTFIGWLVALKWALNRDVGFLDGGPRRQKWRL